MVAQGQHTGRLLTNVRNVTFYSNWDKFQIYFILGCYAHRICILKEWYRSYSSNHPNIAYSLFSVGERFKHCLIRSDMNFVVASRSMKFAWFIYYTLGTLKNCLYSILESQLTYIVISAIRLKTMYSVFSRIVSVHVVNTRVCMSMCRLALIK